MLIFYWTKLHASHRLILKNAFLLLLKSVKKYGIIASSQYECGKVCNTFG